MACFHACLNELPSELRGFAFKGTYLIYVHCVSNENFAITVKGFPFVSLVCREVHILIYAMWKAFANEDLSSLRLLRICLPTNYSQGSEALS